VHWDTSVNLDGTYRALAAALAFSDYGARLTDAQFFDQINRPVGNADTRFQMMQNVIWYYSSGTTGEITQIHNMMQAYNNAAVTSEAISSLWLDYDPETGKMTLGHAGYQSPNPHIRLAWSGDVTGLTVVIDGTTYADTANTAGVVINRNSNINVTYTGAGDVNFALTDSQLYLKKGSLEGGQLETASPGTKQPVVIGYAEFGTLKCDLALSGGNSCETLVFTNTYTKPDKPMAAIYGLKHFTLSEMDSAPGFETYPSYSFTFTISQVSGPPCMLPTPPAVTVPYPGSGTFSFNVTDLEDGTYEFLITETPPAEGSGWSAHTPPQLVTVMVSGHTVTVTYPGNSPSVSFVNEYGVPFEFRKEGYGGIVFGAGDAVFDLFRLGCELEHDHDVLVSNDPACCWVLRETAETDTHGMVTFGLLGSGDYMLVETKTRRDYQIPVGQWLVHVEMSAEKQVTIMACGDHLPPAFYEEEGVFVLTNFPRFVMPRAGSFSLLLFTVGGIAMVGTSAYLGFGALSRKKRRQKAG